MDKYKNFLIDHVSLVIEKIKELESENIIKDDFVLGQKTAYYDVITLLKVQAELFDIDLFDIGLCNIDENKIL